MDGQLNHYVLAAREQGVQFDTVVYNVIRKPGLRPLKATPTEKRRYTGSGDLYAKQRDHDETASEYEIRIDEALKADPAKYFFRREIPRLDYDIDEYAKELWDITKVLRQAQLNDRWYRTANRFNCEHCAYFDICSGLEPFDEGQIPSGFIKLDPEKIHPELGDIQ